MAAYTMPSIILYGEKTVPRRGVYSGGERHPEQGARQHRWPIRQDLLRQPATLGHEGPP